MPDWVLRWCRILAWMAQLSAPHHRDLIRGMVSELDAIADPAERRRFAIGAIVAIIRLALSGYRRAALHALCGDAPMCYSWRRLLPGTYVALLVGSIALVLGCSRFWGCGAWIDLVRPVLMPVPKVLGLPWTLLNLPGVLPILRSWMPNSLPYELIVFVLGIGVNAIVLYLIGATIDRRRLESTLAASTA